MRYVLILLAMSACMRGQNYTVHLEQEAMMITDLRNKACVESGYRVYYKLDDGYYLVTSYSTCDIKIIRRLKPHEIKQWIKE